MNELSELAAHCLPGRAANRAPFGVAAVPDVGGLGIVAAPVEVARVARTITPNIGLFRTAPTLADPRTRLSGTCWLRQFPNLTFHAPPPRNGVPGRLVVRRGYITSYRSWKGSSPLATANGLRQRRFGFWEAAVLRLRPRQAAFAPYSAFSICGRSPPAGPLGRPTGALLLVLQKRSFQSPSRWERRARQLRHGRIEQDRVGHRYVDG